MSPLEKDDLFLVNRDGSSYKVSAEEMKLHFGGTFGRIKKPIILTPDNNEDISGNLGPGGSLSDPYPPDGSTHLLRSDIIFTSSALEYEGDPVEYLYRTWILHKNPQPYENLPGYQEEWELVAVENDPTGPETRSGWSPGDFFFEESMHYRVTVTYTGTKSEVSSPSDPHYFYTEGTEIVLDVDMHGLRFDSSRNTTLTGNKSSSGSFTYSFWFKYTATTIRALSEVTADINDLYILIRESVAECGVGTAAVSAGSIVKNKWQHCVCTYDGTILELYLDGVSIGTGAATVVGNRQLAIGQDRSGASYGDGYMSDVYFVEGQVLPPETFGSDFGGKWAPLDSDDVKINIETKSPEFIAAFPDTDYDTSQAWSIGGDNTNAADNRGWDKAFDGSTNTVASPLDNSAEMTWTGNIPVTSGQSVVFRMWRQELWSGVFEINGTDYASSISNTAEGESPSLAHTAEFTLPITSNITSIKITNTSASTYNKQFGIAYIKIGDKILVDAPSFGANGFYLPFDPAATGENWSSLVTTDSGTFGGGTPADSFDGSESTGCFAATSDAALSQYIVTFNTGLTGNLEVSSYSGNVVTVNGLRLGPNSVDASTDIGIGTYSVSNMTSLMLTMNDEGNSNSRPGIRQLKLDGVLLIDHNSIGVDASGNGNHFHDENFAVGSDTSQVWSNFLTPSSGKYFALPPSNAFDGSESTYAVVSPVPADQTFAPPSLSYLTSFRVKVYVDSLNSPTQRFTLETTTGTETYTASQVGGTGNKWVEFNQYPGTIVSFTQSQPSSGVSNRIFSFVVDGSFLVDKNFQDTVTDTPMRNYAVFGTSDGIGKEPSNGNLQIKPSTTGQHWRLSTIECELNKKYYYETITTNADPTAGSALNFVIAPSGSNSTSQDYVYAYSSNAKRLDKADVKVADGTITQSVGDIVGITFDSSTGTITQYVNGSLDFTYTDADIIGKSFKLGAGKGSNETFHTTINYGQQPFAASNVTYNQAAGTVEIGGVTYETLYKSFEDNTSFGNRFYVERSGELIYEYELNRFYGLNKDNCHQAGIFQLTEQPTSTPISYIRNGNKYAPVYDYESILDDLSIEFNELYEIYQDSINSANDTVGEDTVGNDTVN